jgi:hypothetical protein
MFLFVVQMTFITTILGFETFDTAYKNDTAVNFCLFFTVLILHWQCVPDARNGISMMKYALCCPNEFDQPVAVFGLGCMQIMAIVLTEICNLMKSVDQKSPQNVIVRFVGFSLIISTPKLLHPSIEKGLEVKAAVGRLELRNGRKSGLNNYALLNTIYCSWKWFYKSIYFYFFPLLVVFPPLIKITYILS